MENKEEKRESLREIVLKISSAQPLMHMKPERIAGFFEENFNAKIAPETINPYLFKNDFNGLLDRVVDEMIKR